jgi:UDP-N-acetylmuramoyl-tripeptide--D-alanyl-D-alanine ligase
VETGAVALASLAIIEYLRAEPEMDAERRAALESKLDGYLRFVRTMQMPAGDFHLGVTRGVNVKIGRTSPYFDGEAQLALVKAIRYTGRAEFLPVLQRAVEKNAPKYTVEAWRKARDSDDTKSFYQWGTMSLCEYVDAGFPNAPTYADAVLALAWWQLYTHKTLMKTRNSAYAFEGLVHAYRLAKSQGDARAAADLARTIDKGLYRLTSWQVGGPLAERNSFLRGHPTSDPLAIGGVMNERNKAPLRIDVAQHQMHAVILALKTIYTE